MTERSSAPLPECIEVETAPDPRAAVIWLHGLGADGHDFEPIVPELGPLPVATRFVFPHAPMMPITINGGAVMRAWYDIVTPDLARREDQNGVRASHRVLNALIEREVQRGIPRRSIVTAGFSQGGAIVLYNVIRQTEPLAGAIALSTYLPGIATAGAEAVAAGKMIPIFYGQGPEDGVVSIERAQSSRHALLALECPVQWHEYPIQHTLSIEEISHVKAWLAERLAAAR